MTTRARISLLFVVAAAVAVLGLSSSAMGAAGFARADDMDTGRFSFAAVSLAGGSVLVVGGDTAELYDPAADAFSPAGAVTASHGEGLTATLLANGQVLIAGGQVGDASTANAEIYDPAAGTFTPTGAMTSPRSFHTATLLPDGRVLVAGGHTSNHPGSSIAGGELYDPVTGTFTPTGSMSVARQDHTATLLANGTVLIAGGYDVNQIALTSAEIYAPAQETFSATGSMASGRGNHTATVLGGGDVLVAGGHAGFPAGSLASAELYQPETGTFSPAGDMTVERGAHTATLLPDGTVLLVGGFTAFPFLGTTLASAEIYEPGTGSFTGTASMHDPRGRHAAAPLPGGDVLVLGGLSECCGGGSAGTEIFMLSVVDTRPPRIIVPDDVTTVAAGPDGAFVGYTVTAVDNFDPNPTVTCQPASDSLFPIGTTTVSCTASDADGNTSSASFQVTVLTPFDLSIAIDASGSVRPKTGVVTVTGVVRCNRAAGIFISGELNQPFTPRATLQGSYQTEIVCTPPASPWRATVTAANGRFAAGYANATASAFACDAFTCDFDSQAATIVLRGKP